MNAPLREEVLTLREASPQASLPLAAEGIQRFVWEHRFGSMLIEVDGDEVRVNGEVVQPVPSKKPEGPAG
ncbi:hypothetical protein [Azohydromonas australica]|uniref:hypothetical protein n=1 Tax=Azohydromonas australica TaxID=364039 RepID=UPI00048FB256|nr:hypothetical protein [Azohydromonas australica]